MKRREPFNIPEEMNPSVSSHRAPADEVLKTNVFQFSFVSIRRFLLLLLLMFPLLLLRLLWLLNILIQSIYSVVSPIEECVDANVLMDDRFQPGIPATAA